MFGLGWKIKLYGRILSRDANQGVLFIVRVRPHKWAPGRMLENSPKPGGNLLKRVEAVMDAVGGPTSYQTQRIKDWNLNLNAQSW